MSREIERDSHKFIWVVSYPKSGNTWMRLLLRTYFKEVYGQEPFETGDTTPYFYQVVSPKPLHLLSGQEIAQIRPAAMLHLTSINGARAVDKPVSVIKSHFMNASVAGIPMFSPLWTDYAIYIYRDPRDVLPSLADHMGKTIPEAVEMMRDPLSHIGDTLEGGEIKIPTPLGTWSDHVKSWMGPEKRVSMAATSYERLHADTAGELTRLLDFCKIEVDRPAVKKAVEACTFRNLRAAEDQIGFKERSRNSEHFFRRGLVGSHKDEVEPGYVQQIEHDHKLAMRMLGYA